MCRRMNGSYVADPWLASFGLPLRSNKRLSSPPGHHLPVWRSLGIPQDAVNLMFPNVHICVMPALCFMPEIYTRSCIDLGGCCGNARPRHREPHVVGISGGSDGEANFI